MHIPFVRPAEPFRVPPPRRPPLLRASSAGALVAYAIFTAALAWLAGWFALAVPVSLALAYWRQARVYGLLPPRLHRIRRLLDVVVVGACVAATWETPAAELTVPLLLGLLVYAALRVVRVQAGARAVAAVSAATAWLALVGGPTDSLSACRIADGTPGRTADAYAHAVLTADLARADRYESRKVQEMTRRLVRRLPNSAAAAVVAQRRSLGGTPYCRYLRSTSAAVDCYGYPAKTGLIGLPLAVGVGCHGRRWRVDAAA
jgi:hypothetical protein